MLDGTDPDVELYTEFRCADKCDAGVLLRTEKTPEGGWKGVYVPLSADGGHDDLKLNADGKGVETGAPADVDADMVWTTLNGRRMPNSATSDRMMGYGPVALHVACKSEVCFRDVAIKDLNRKTEPAAQVSSTSGCSS